MRVGARVGVGARSQSEARDAGVPLMNRGRDAPVAPDQRVAQQGTARHKVGRGKEQDLQNSDGREEKLESSGGGGK